MRTPLSYSLQKGWDINSTTDDCNTDGTWCGCRKKLSIHATGSLTTPINTTFSFSSSLGKKCPKKCFHPILVVLYFTRKLVSIAFCKKLVPLHRSPKMVNSLMKSDFSLRCKLSFFRSISLLSISIGSSSGSGSPSCRFPCFSLASTRPSTVNISHAHGRALP